MNKIKLPNAAYDVLKWVALIAIPAVATFYGVLSTVWGLPYGTEICATLSALATMIGTLIGISHVNINREKEGEENEQQQPR